MLRRSQSAKSGSLRVRVSRRWRRGSCDCSCPSRLPGLGHVNCYAMEDARGITLVDPGLPGPKTWRELQRIMKAGGLAIERVHSVVITHSHPDHFGQAGQFRKRFGAEVITHQTFRTFLDPEAEDQESADELEIIDAAGEGAGRVGAGPGPASWTVREAHPVGRRSALDATLPTDALLGDAQGGGSLRRRRRLPRAGWRMPRCSSWAAASGWRSTRLVTPSITSASTTRRPE